MALFNPKQIGLLTTLEIQSIWSYILKKKKKIKIKKKN